MLMETAVRKNDPARTVNYENGDGNMLESPLEIGELCLATFCRSRHAKSPTHRGGFGMAMVKTGLSLALLTDHLSLSDDYFSLSHTGDVYQSTLVNCSSCACPLRLVHRGENFSSFGDGVI